MNGVVAIVAFGALALLLVKAGKSDAAASGLEDAPISAANIRMGVQNGFYTCTLLRVDHIPAVRLSGRLKNGKVFTDVYRVSEDDWQALKKEGFPTE